MTTTTDHAAKLTELIEGPIEKLLINCEAENRDATPKELATVITPALAALGMDRGAAIGDDELMYKVFDLVIALRDALLAAPIDGRTPQQKYTELLQLAQQAPDPEPLLAIADRWFRLI